MIEGTTPELYTLSLHDALPIFGHRRRVLLAEPDQKRILLGLDVTRAGKPEDAGFEQVQDRKSTRLNSSHVEISYAVFCLKKKMTITVVTPPSQRECTTRQLRAD